MRLDPFEKSVVVMLVGNTLSPKIQATLNVGERRFCVNVPLQARPCSKIPVLCNRSLYQMNTHIYICIYIILYNVYLSVYM